MLRQPQPYRHPHFILSIAFFITTSMIAGVAVPQNDGTDSGSAARSAPESREQANRGRYLVHHLAMCVQCHSPRNSDGTLVEEEFLQGGRIAVERPFPNQKWALHAPKLAGLPGGWSEKQMVTFLQTGRTPANRFTEPPMPPFRMTAEDAQAVAAYLQSIERD